MKITSISVFALNVLCCSMPLVALATVAKAAESKNGLNAELAVNSELTDNANRKKVKQEMLAERQDHYSLSLNTTYNNDWIQFGSAYEASSVVYNEFSQPDYSVLEGESSLIIGNQQQPLTVLLAHSRRSLLNAPDAEDITSNLDQRNILMVQPMMRWNATAADSILLKTSISNITYSSAQNFNKDTVLAENKKSQRKSTELSWVRSISKTDQLQLSLENSNATFGKDNTSNYQYQKASAFYSVQLNHFSYSIDVGGNRAKPDANVAAYTRPSYGLTSSYLSGSNTFKLMVNQQITDSSAGDNNRLNVVGVSAGHSSTGVGLNLINLLNVEFAWNTKALCDRCDIGIYALNNTERYQIINDISSTNNDNVEYGVGTNFSYTITRAASVKLNVERKKRIFENNPDRDNLLNDRVRLAFNYSFWNQLAVRLYAEKNALDIANFSKSYDVKMIGIEFVYNF